MIHMKILRMMKMFPRALKSVQSDDVSVSWEPSKSRSSLEQARYHVSPIRNNSFQANTWTHTKRNTHTNVCKQSHTNQRLQKNVSHHKDAHAYTNTCTQLGYTWESKLQCGGTATMLNTLHKHTLTPISDDGDADNHAFVEHFTFYHLKYHQGETYITNYIFSYLARLTM